MDGRINGRIMGGIMSEPLSPAALRARLDYSDERLLAECAFDTYRASGPGGQKRNKTSSAVRLRHRLSGLSAIAEESRSQHENKARALRRLREEIALHARLPVAPSPPSWPENVQVKDERLQISAENASRPKVLAILLDALAAAQGRVGEAAQTLGISGSSMTRALRDHGGAWAETNRIRAVHGLSPLRD